MDHGDSALPDNDASGGIADKGMGALGMILQIHFKQQPHILVLRRAFFSSLSSIYTFNFIIQEFAYYFNICTEISDPARNPSD